MATTLTLPDGIRPEDLMAAISLLKASTPQGNTSGMTMHTDTPQLTAETPKRKRTKKAPAESAPAPVLVTATNGARVDLTDPYRRMVAFTHQAIRVLRATDKASDPKHQSKGIHSVFSGFNAAFGQHFGLAKEQVYASVDVMAERGDICKRFARGGVMLYLPGEMPVQAARKDPGAVLALILGTK